MNRSTTWTSRDLPDGLIGAKVDTAHPGATEVVHELCRFGFRLITVEITFEGDALLGREVRSDEMDSVRRASVDDYEPVRRIAATCFTHDRFHSDPMIESEAADSIKAEWVSNFFKGARGTDLYVSENQGEVNGFLLAIQETGRLVVDLIAVKESARGRGIAQRMIRYAASVTGSVSAEKHVVVSVGTQLMNTASIRSYTALGLTLASSRYVFHRVWPKR